MFPFSRRPEINRNGTDTGRRRIREARLPYFSAGLLACSLEIPGAFVDKSVGDFPLEKIKSPGELGQR